MLFKCNTVFSQSSLKESAHNERRLVQAQEDIPVLVRKQSSVSYSQSRRVSFHITLSPRVLTDDDEKKEGDSTYSGWDNVKISIFINILH